VDNRSLSDITFKLRELQVPTPTGEGLWYASTVHNLIKNPAYIGETYRFAETYRQPEASSGMVGRKRTRVQRPLEERIALPNATPPIIQREVFEAAQAKLLRNKALAKRNARHDYLLRGLVRCGRCGRNYWGHVKVKRNSSSEGRYYRCAGRLAMVSPSRCDNHILNATELENQVWAEIEKVIAKPQDLLREFEQRDHLGQKALIEDKLEQVEGRFNSVQKRYNGDVLLFEWGGIENAEMKRKVNQWRADKERYAREKADLEAELAKVHEIEVCWEKVEEFCKMLRQHQGSDLTDKEKRLALEGLGVEVLVDGDEVVVTGQFMEKVSMASIASSPP
jgi:site-specific DNA recombinase